MPYHCMKFYFCDENGHTAAHSTLNNHISCDDWNEINFSSKCLTLSRLLTDSECVFSPLQMAALLDAVRRVTRWVLQHGYTNNTDERADYCHILLNLIYKYAYLKIYGRSLLSAMLKRVVVFLQTFILEKTWRCSATKESLANAVALFTLFCVSSRLWNTTVFRTGLMFGMAQCKVDLNLTVFLWMHMHIWSVTMFLRQLFLCPLLN